MLSIRILERSGKTTSKLWGKVDPEAKSGVQASEVGQVRDLPGEAGDDAVMP